MNCDGAWGEFIWCIVRLSHIGPESARYLQFGDLTHGLNLALLAMVHFIKLMAIFLLCNIPQYKWLFCIRNAKQLISHKLKMFSLVAKYFGPRATFMKTAVFFRVLQLTEKFIFESALLDPLSCDDMLDHIQGWEEFDSSCYRASYKMSDSMTGWLDHMSS